MAVEGSSEVAEFALAELPEAQNAEAAAQVRGVWVSDQMTEGTRAIRIEADALDATVFEHTIDAIAGTLAAGTDTGAPTRRPARLAVRCDLPGVEFWSTVR